MNDNFTFIAEITRVLPDFVLQDFTIEERRGNYSYHGYEPEYRYYKPVKIKGDIKLFGAWQTLCIECALDCENFTETSRWAIGTKHRLLGDVEVFDRRDVNSFEVMWSFFKDRWNVKLDKFMSNSENMRSCGFDNKER